MSSSKIIRLCALKRRKSVDNRNRKPGDKLLCAGVKRRRGKSVIKKEKRKVKRGKSVVENDGWETGKLLCPSKRCKSIVAESENTITGEDDDPKKLLCPLKSCKSIEDDNESGTDSDFDGDGINPPRKLKGKHLDVISFLSNNGDTTYLARSNGQFVALDFVLGKHLLICCLSLPVSSDNSYFRAMIATYSHVPRPDFETVLVVSTRSKSDFVDFFSADIPCFAIPFSDYSTRDSICSFIGFKHHRIYLDVSAIMVDPTGRISHYCGTPELFHDYGFEWFGRNVDDINTQDHVLRSRLDLIYRYGLGALPEDIKMDPLLGVPLSLHKDILLCNPSHMLSRFGGAGAGAGQSSLMVSELSNKYVGLYLCINMYFLEKLHEIHQQCVINKQELEIVLVCMPLFQDSKPFHKQLIKALKRYNITSWFIFPYEDKVCRRIWRIFAQEWNIDRFIILPPNCISGELEGRTVVEQIGIKSYPFTRSTILEQRMTALKSLNPISWFKGTSKKLTCLFRNDTESIVPLSEIKGKKLLLYLDWLDLSDDHGELCRLLIKHYSEIQAMGCEVVFVPLDHFGTLHVQFAEMPWPIMPLSATVQNLLTRQLVFRYSHRYRQLFAVGEDGEILATRAEKRLTKYGVTDYLFHDKLRTDIMAELYNFRSEEREYN